MCDFLSFCFKYLNIVVFILMVMVVVILLSRSDLCSKLYNTLYRQQVRNPKCALCLFLDTALYGLYDMYCVVHIYHLKKIEISITIIILQHSLSACTMCYMHAFIYFFFIISKNIISHFPSASQFFTIIFSWCWPVQTFNFCRFSSSKE